MRELGPIVKLLSSAALVDGANEVVLNIGVIKGPMDSPVIADFAGNLDRINDAFPPPDAVPSPTPIIV